MTDERDVTNFQGRAGCLVAIWYNCCRQYHLKILLTENEFSLIYLVIKIIHQLRKIMKHCVTQ